MARVSDKIALYLSVAALAYIAGAYITNDYRWGILPAVAAVGCILAAGKLRGQRKGSITYAAWVDMLLLEGKAKSNEYLHILYPMAREVKENEYVSTDGKYVVNSISFAKPSEEWAADLYRRWHGNPTSLVVAATDIDRKALGILSAIGVNVKILRPKEMLRRLKKQGVSIDYNHPKRHMDWRTLLGTLSMRHAVYFALTAAGCLALSVWVPFKAYYYAFAGVNAVLCLVVLLIKKFVKE